MRLELTDDQEVRPRAAQIDADDQFSRDLVRKADARGLMGVTIPPAWGGAGRDSSPLRKTTFLS